MEAAPLASTHAASAETLDPDTVRVLRDDGTLDPAVDIGAIAADDRVIALYRQIVRLRALDEQLIRQQREGKIGSHTSALGEEAAILGSVAMLREQDWVFPSSREFGAVLARGMALQAYVHHMFGTGHDPIKGRQMPNHPSARAFKVSSVSSVVGAQITQAVGLAWAAKLRKEELVALTYFGEGATSGGDFHNGMNFAGVFKTPVVFFCRNNGWATSMPAERQTASSSFFIKGIAYGVPGVRCDGSDLFAVMKVTRDAIARAAAGKGPTIIEAVTTPLGRLGPDAEKNKRKDPIARLRRYLDAQRLWSDEKQLELEVRVGVDISTALTAAENAAPPALGTMFDDVYAEIPWHLHDQREALLNGPRYSGFAKSGGSAKPVEK